MRARIRRPVPSILACLALALGIPAAGVHAGSVEAGHAASSSEAEAAQCRVGGEPRARGPRLGDQDPTRLRRKLALDPTGDGEPVIVLNHRGYRGYGRASGPDAIRHILQREAELQGAGPN